MNAEPLGPGLHLCPEDVLGGRRLKRLPRVAEAGVPLTCEMAREGNLVTL